jgi:RNA polymerase sigma factor (sigma-70 family)
MKDDRALVRRVLEGDQTAFRELIKAYEKLVFHMVNRLVDVKEDREDLCQEIFLKVYRHLPKFQFQSQLSTWIASIAYRTTINHLRKQKKYQETDLDVVSFSLEDIHLNADHQMDRQHIHHYIHQMIKQLPIQYRTVLTLYHLEEMSYAEIGEISEMPEGTVKNYLFRARKLLKEKLEMIFKKEELL